MEAKSMNVPAFIAAAFEVFEGVTGTQIGSPGDIAKITKGLMELFTFVRIDGMEETLLSPLEAAEVAAKLLEHKRYKELEQAGRLRVLPCSPGDTLYFVDLNKKEIYREAEATEHIGIGWTTKSDIGDYVPAGCFGKTVFTSPDAALSAIAANIITGGVLDA